MLVGIDNSDQEEISLFLTGGTGFFGRSILRYLSVLSDNLGRFPWKVTVMSRSPEKFLAQHPEFSNLHWLSFHAGDILSASSGFPEHGTFTHVLHAATDSTLGPSMSSLDRFDQIVTGTRNTLDFAIKSGAKRFLLTSSGGVYGVQPEAFEKIPETYLGMPDPLYPENTYSVAKRLAEHLCVLYGEKYGMTMVVARCFAFVGPDLPLNAHFAIGNFIRDAMQCPEIIVNGNGMPLRSYLYQDDLVSWLLELMIRGRNFHAYNVGSDEAVSIADLAYLVRDVIAPDKPVRIKGDVNADTMVRNRYIPDIKKVSDEFGLHATISLSDAIRKTVDKIEKNKKELRNV